MLSVDVENILENIYKAGTKFLEPLTTEETYATIVDEAVKLIGGQYGLIILPVNGKLERAYVSVPMRYRTSIRKKGITYEVFTKREAKIAHITETGRVHPELKGYGIRSTIFIPLAYGNKSIGVLAVNSRKDTQFNHKELNILKLFGSLASLAIRKTQLYDESRKALEVRDLFISIAAHEFRTPLTSVSGYIQLLQSKLANKDSVESRWIEHLSWECSRLTNLTNELLALNRIKTGQFQFFWEECDLRQVVERSIDNFRFANPNRVVDYQDELGKRRGMVIGDFDKLIQVTNNLLDNAAKFSPENSPIMMKILSKGSFIKLEVEDQGEGVDKKELRRVFEDFYKGSSNVKTGMGLGLFLTKTIVEEHRGEIKFKSARHKGTVVSVTLPRVNI